MTKKTVSHILNKLSHVTSPNVKLSFIEIKRAHILGCRSTCKFGKSRCYCSLLFDVIPMINQDVVVLDVMMILLVWQPIGWIRLQKYMEENTTTKYKI